MLKRRYDAMEEIPLRRMDWRMAFDADMQRGKSYTNRGSFVDDAECFDNKRFNISAAEAGCMDPQQRMTLEVTFAACMEAGI